MSSDQQALQPPMWNCSKMHLPFEVKELYLLGVGTRELKLGRDASERSDE